MRELSGPRPLLDIDLASPLLSHIAIHPGHRQWRPQPLWAMRRALSPGSASPMAAPSIELAISAFGEVDVAQLTTELSRQSRTGEG